MDVDKLKVAELKDELKKRGLPHTGLKAILVKRLKDAMGIPSDGNASFSGSQDSFNSSQEMSPVPIHSNPNVGFTPQIASQQMVNLQSQFGQQSPMIGFHQGQVMPTHPQQAMQSSPILINPGMQQQPVTPTNFGSPVGGGHPVIQPQISPQMLSPQHQFYMQQQQQPSVQQLRANVSPQQIIQNIPPAISTMEDNRPVQSIIPANTMPQPGQSLHQHYVSTSEMVAADISLRPDFVSQSSSISGDIDSSMAPLNTTSNEHANVQSSHCDIIAPQTLPLVQTEINEPISSSDKTSTHTTSEDPALLHQQYISNSEMIAENKSFRPGLSIESPAITASVASNFVEPKPSNEVTSTEDLHSSTSQIGITPQQPMNEEEAVPLAGSEIISTSEPADSKLCDTGISSKDGVTSSSTEGASINNAGGGDVTDLSNSSDANFPLEPSDMQSPEIHDESLLESSIPSQSESSILQSRADNFGKSSEGHTFVAQELMENLEDEPTQSDSPIESKSTEQLSPVGLSQADIFAQVSPAPIQADQPHSSSGTASEMEQEVQPNEAKTSTEADFGRKSPALIQPDGSLELTSTDSAEKEEQTNEDDQMKEEDDDDKPSPQQEISHKETKNLDDSYDISKERMKIYGGDYRGNQSQERGSSGRRQSKSKTRSRSPVRRVEPKIKDEPLKLPEEPEDWDLRTDVFLDWFNSDLTVEISASGFEAKSIESPGFETMWAGVRASYGVTAGKVFFELKVLENLHVASTNGSGSVDNVTRVGWSVNRSGFALGEESLSYGYGGIAKKSTDMKFANYGESYGPGDVIGAFYELDSENTVQLSFSKNGSPLGSAYEVPLAELEGAALFPHVYIKNVRFEVNFGQTDAWFPPPDDSWTAISLIPVEQRVRGNPPPRTFADCEMLMMCGLPAAGKTHWAEQRMQEMPEKNYNILSTHLILEKMKIMGIGRKRNTNERWDVLVDRSNKCLSKLIQIAPTKRRNYILDQNNVYASGQNRKMRPFEKFRRIAVIIVPSDDVLQDRIIQSEQDEGKDVPENAVLEMKANFCIPSAPSEFFDDVIFPELGKEEAAALVEDYNREGREKLERNRGGKRDDRSRHDHRSSHRESSYHSRERGSDRDRKRSRFDSSDDRTSSHRDAKEPRREFSRFSEDNNRGNRDRGMNRYSNDRSDRDRDHGGSRNNNFRGGDNRFRRDEPFHRGGGGDNRGFRGGYGGGFSRGGDRGDRGRGNWGARNDNRGRGFGGDGNGRGRGGGGRGGFDPSNRGGFNGPNRGGYEGGHMGARFNQGGGRGGFRGGSQSGHMGRPQGGFDDSFSHNQSFGQSMMYNTPQNSKSVPGQHTGYPNQAGFMPSQDNSASQYSFPQNAPSNPQSGDAYSNSIAAAQMYNMQHAAYYPNQPGGGGGGGGYGQGGSYFQ